MDNIQTDVSDKALVISIRANMCDFFRHLSRSNPERHFDNGKFTRWYTPLPHPWFNGILCSNPPADNDESFILETIQYFRDKKVGVFTCWMETHVKASEWRSLLSKHGFCFSDGTPGMAVDLHETNDSVPPMDGLEIREVRDEESLRMWAKAFVNGYGLPSDWEALMLDLWTSLGLDLPLRNYLGYWNGEPVSTSSVFFSGGVAGIYCVSTLPEARGKGIGAALTLHPLLEARDMGYRVGILQSSEMGFGVYKKLGFRHLCQIENFYLSLQ